MKLIRGLNCPFKEDEKIFIRSHNTAVLDEGFWTEFTDERSPQKFVKVQGV